MMKKKIHPFIYVTGFFFKHMQTINWWLGCFHVDFLDNVVHSFIIHSSIHSFIHALVVTIPYVQIACPTMPGGGAHNLPRA
jgi:hypothetical protein